MTNQQPPMSLYVDADACPVKSEIVRVGERHGLVMHMVSNSWMRLDDSDLVRRVVVDQGADVADDWIAEQIAPGDIAITADIPLAARCLEKGAGAIGPNGKPFTVDNIGMALAMRELNSDLRDSGAISGAGPQFSAKDRTRFLNNLENMIQKIKRGR